MTAEADRHFLRRLARAERLFAEGPQPFDVRAWITQLIDIMVRTAAKDKRNARVRARRALRRKAVQR